jgi:hypothetical protein
MAEPSKRRSLFLFITTNLRNYYYQPSLAWARICQTPPKLGLATSFTTFNNTDKSHDFAVDHSLRRAY